MAAAVSPLRAVTEGNLLDAAPMRSRRRRIKPRRFAQPARQPSTWKAPPWRQIAAQHNLPFIAVRVIVDTAADMLPRAVVAASRAGRVRLARLIGGLILAPREIALADPARAALSNCDALIARHRRASRMKALVTGATGFVGAAVARALLGGQWQVRVLARRGSDRRNLKSLDVEVFEGDLTDSSSLQRATQGCDGLFHVAADYRLGARDPKELYRANVEGTRNVLNAAHRSGVRRIVYTSSVATIGIPADGTPGR